MKSSFIQITFIFFLLSHFAYPWGAEGHRAIGEAAKAMLTPQAKASIQKILGNDDLAAVSTWLDDVRNAHKHHSGPLAHDPEVKAFNTKFPKNELWHFVDLPVGSTAYSESSPFASKDDVVHAINNAIDVLEGRLAQFTKVQALRILVHLVGDIHQPMHTVSGYYDVSDPQHPKLITDASAAVGKPNDRGGNQLFHTKTLELHAMWDTKLVTKLDTIHPNTPLAKQLAGVASSQAWLTPGDYHLWAKQWVGDSATVANIIYKNITFGPATLASDHSIQRIEITIADKYSASETTLAKMQLAKGAVHLAQLLNSIRYK